MQSFISNSTGKRAKVLVLAGLDRSLINFRGSLIKALRNSGLEVHAAAPCLLANTDVVNELSSWGVVSHNVPLQRAGLNPLKDLLGFFNLVRLMLKVRPTFVLSYTIKPVIYGTFAAWLSRVPHRFALITGLGYAFASVSSLKGRLIQSVGRSFYSVALRRAELVFYRTQMMSHCCVN
ncbi:glycosyltransferase [Vreelandella azerica]|uniref:glycosyltransferase n=1 Tax=Vreelandella azerica TaxID=2732867 RepID=UPI001F21A682|nr:glycosyltransferase [Halomonas azerica]